MEIWAALPLSQQFSCFIFSGRRFCVVNTIGKEGCVPFVYLKSKSDLSPTQNTIISSRNTPSHACDYALVLSSHETASTLPKDVVSTAPHRLLLNMSFFSKYSLLSLSTSSFDNISQLAKGVSKSRHCLKKEPLTVYGCSYFGSRVSQPPPFIFYSGYGHWHQSVKFILKKSISLIP